MSVQINDLMLAAVADAEAVNHIFARVTVDAQWVILKAGQGKQLWNEGMDTTGRTVEIIFRLNPIDATGQTRMQERSVISTSSTWSRIVWPPLKGMGYKVPSEIDGLWAHAEMVPDGRSWKDKTTGEERFGSTFRFIKVFKTEAECEIAYKAFSGNEAHSTGSAPVARPTVSQPKQVSEEDRPAAFQLLRFVVMNHKDNLAALPAALANTPLVKDFYTMSSPEVMEILTPFGA